MKCIASCVLATALAAVVVMPVKAQEPAASRTAATPAKGQPGGDQVIDGLRFHPLPGGGFIQVFDGKQNAGTIILPPNQPPMLSPLPGYGDRLKLAFEKYTAGSVQPAKNDTVAVAPTNAGGSDPAATSGFDKATNTVTLPDGVRVTFVDDNTVKVSGFHGQDFTLHHKGASGLGFVRSTVIAPAKGKVGGSIGGGGVEIKQDGSGRLVYDSSQGTAYRGTLPLAKGVSQEVSDAVDQVRQVPGHTNFAPAVARDIKGILSL